MKTLYFQFDEDKLDTLRHLLPALGLFCMMFRNPYDYWLVAIYAVAMIPFTAVTNFISSLPWRIVVIILFMMLATWGILNVHYDIVT